MVPCEGTPPEIKMKCAGPADCSGDAASPKPLQARCVAGPAEPPRAANDVCDVPHRVQIVKAVMPLQAAVETQRKYKHVLWYSLFVAAYLIVLYLQASAYNSGEVVSTLRNQLMPGKPPQLCCICVRSSAALLWGLQARHLRK